MKVLPRLWTQFLAKTVTSPTNFAVPTHFLPKSAILLSTPHNLPSVIENAITLHQIANLQVVVAGVDAVPIGARNGVSELWMAEHLNIGSSVRLSDTDSDDSGARTDGIRFADSKSNWKNIQGTLNLKIGPHTVGARLANTAFSTGKLITMFYFQPKGVESGSAEVLQNSGEMLSDLSLKLPDLALHLPLSTDRWTSLTDEELRVTKCTGNLIKGINNKSAASYLETNDKLMSIASKDTKVYVTVTRDGKSKRFEVIAGGGGWGAKADLLALSPEARLSKGDHLQFFMVTPDNRFLAMSTAAVSNQFHFECTPEQTSYQETSLQQTVENLFGCGSEMGFTLDGMNHASAGETVSFRFK